MSPSFRRSWRGACCWCRCSWSRRLLASSSGGPPPATRRRLLGQRPWLVSLWVKRSTYSTRADSLGRLPCAACPRRRRRRARAAAALHLPAASPATARHRRSQRRSLNRRDRRRRDRAARGGAGEGGAARHGKSLAATSSRLTHVGDHTTRQCLIRFFQHGPPSGRKRSSPGAPGWLTREAAGRLCLAATLPTGTPSAHPARTTAVETRLPSRTGDLAHPSFGADWAVFPRDQGGACRSSPSRGHGGPLLWRRWSPSPRRRAAPR
jgi:hypothetical protein